MRIDLGKLTRLIGGVVLGVIAIGMIVNAKDIQRYIRISTM
jgi:hypothetical protein